MMAQEMEYCLQETQASGSRARQLCPYTILFMQPTHPYADHDMVGSIFFRTKLMGFTSYLTWLDQLIEP